MKKRPHIIIFNPDHYRTDSLAHLGQNPAAVTPHVDEFVRNDAVSFSNAFCQATVCTPSRCCFMSGWYPHTRGHRSMYHMLRGRENDPMLLKDLKDAGYHVWWGGKNDVVAAQEGFDAYCDVKFDIDQYGDRLKPIWKMNEQKQWQPPFGEKGHFSTYVGKLDKGDEEFYFDHDAAFVEGAVDFIKHGVPDDKPICLFLPLVYPHPPFCVEEPFFSMIDRAKVNLPRPVPEDWANKPAILKGIKENLALDDYTEKDWRELIAVFNGMCSRVDAQFGMVTDALKEAGMYDESAIFFMSDHGMYLGDYGVLDLVQNTFDDVITRVPLAVKPPKGMLVKPGIHDGLVELTDLSATVHELAGIRPEYTAFGTSLLPAVAGDAAEVRDAVFASGGRTHGEEHCMEKNSNSFSNKDAWYWPRISIQDNDVNHTKAAMCRTKTHKYVNRLYERDELYDLKKDPQELHNVVDDPAYAKVLAELKDRMLRWYHETGDAVPWDYDKR